MLNENPCAVFMKTIHVNAKNTMKRKASLAKLRGVGLICKAIPIYENVGIEKVVMAEHDKRYQSHSSVQGCSKLYAGSI